MTIIIPIINPTFPIEGIIIITVLNKFLNIPKFDMIRNTLKILNNLKIKGKVLNE